MAHVAVEKFKEGGLESPSFIQKMETMVGKIRERAFSHFEHRAEGGSAFDDWLRAERDLIMTPESELIEKEGKYEMRVAAPGFTASETTVTALPDAVIVSAKSNHKHEEKDGDICFCEFGSKSLYRRLDLSKPINVDKVTASLDDGIVRITAHKAEGNALVAKASA